MKSPLRDSHEFAGVRVFWMRTGITVHLNPTDRKRLQVIVDDRNSPQKRIWRAHGLAPHRIRTFKLSNDPNFGRHQPLRRRL